MRNARRISRGIGLMAALAGFVLVSGGAPAAWGQTFTETHKIIAADTEERDGFGHAVAISGNTAIVGAVLASPNTYMGSAYLFDAATGTELFKLSPNDAAPGDHFGYSVSISGDIAIVGARSGSAGDGSGAAYLFDAATGNELFKLTGSIGRAHV